MADVRLTATNPEDSSVVPVACDAAGRLLLEEPQVIEGPPGEQGQPGDPGPPGQDGQDGDPFSGNFAGDVTFGGSGEFAGIVTVSDIDISSNSSSGCEVRSDGLLRAQRSSGSGSAIFQGWRGNLNTSVIVADGRAEFAGDVVVGSRNKQWMLVEQGGLCHMVEQVRATTADLVAPAADGKYPELRDVFAELNIVEKALEEVMVKLRMQVPAGWPVWDGSDEIATLPRKDP